MSKTTEFDDDFVAYSQDQARAALGTNSNDVTVHIDSLLPKAPISDEPYYLFVWP